ncbi:MAG: UDP-N-acetylmuramate dehydrogenase [Treponema sp.]|jgi:UDP-N-acetylmuramate dehydrogenase|nr:UDP-N-acetylmuramate dehydrogenase [Treponema sp.]
MLTLQKFIEKINSRAKFDGLVRFGESMALHTTFKTGGPADLWIQPGDCFPAYVPFLLKEARAGEIPVFVLGGGSNLVVSDRGIRGITLDTGGWKGHEVKIPDAGRRGSRGPETARVEFRSGTPADQAAETAAALGLSGLEFLAGMPGTAGGAVWMNARCYGHEAAGVLAETLVLDENFEYVKIPGNVTGFSYKKSPFQRTKAVIVSVTFDLVSRPVREIREEMEDHRRDRKAKGHYRYPSAGSAFKNNRAFGKPAGKLIDELGLRGLSSGGARVAPFHGNIIINTGNASSADIRNLAVLVADRVRAETGLELEPEILFAGEW